MKGVFEIGSTTYGDDPALRYHFPSRYLKTVHACVGDWIVYRDTRRGGGTTAYVGVARVDAVKDDPAHPGKMHFAIMSSMMDFDFPVPFKNSHGIYAENRFREVESHLIGRTAQGHAVREISNMDFAAIVDAGISSTLDPENAIRLELDKAHLDADTIEQIVEPDMERRVAQMLVNRKVRDANFRRNVLQAYDSRCAVTGIRIINGGGKAEAQGAHIWPVAKGGPDVVRNGIALSSTVHWMFDRHLISLTDDYELLVSHNKVPSELRNLFPPTGQRIHLPNDARLYPSLDYVAMHREIFAGH